MRTQERDSGGRFSGIRDTEIDAMIAAENEEAQKLIKVCDLLGFKPEEFGIKKFKETGNYNIDHNARSRFLGIILGLGIALGKPRKKAIRLLRDVCDALGLMEKMRKNENLQKQRRQVVL